MALVRAFPGVRYDSARVDLGRVLLAAPSDDEAADPRTADLLRRPAPAGPFFRSEWLRAGVLTRDEAPALYVVRQTVTAGEDDEEHLGFFAEVELGRGGEVHDLVEPAEGLDRFVFEDPRGKVRRIVRSDIEEREADVRMALPGRTLELFVVDDETTCARVSTQLEGTDLWRVGGAHAGDAPFLGYFALQDEDGPPLRSPRLLAGPGESLESVLDAARAFFEVRPETAASALARARAGEGVAAITDAAAALLILRADAPLDDLLDQDPTTPLGLASVVRIVLGGEVEVVTGPLAPGPRAAFHLPPPPFPPPTDAPRMPTGSVALSGEVPFGLVLR